MTSHRSLLRTARRYAVLSAVWAIVSLQAQPVHVQVDADRMIRSINPLLYGINTARWDESLFPGPSSEMLLTCDQDAIRKIRASGVTMLKYPGGNDADHYVWNSPSNNPTEMDTDEYLALCRQVGAEPFITVNFNEPPELAAAWVRYCNVGRTHPVKYWEVGDEQWGSWAKGHSTPEEYAKKYVRFVRAMKAVDPTISVATNVALAGTSSSLGGKSGGWTERVLKTAGDDIDMLTITFYPQEWGRENDDSLLASVATYRALFTGLRQSVERIVGKKKADAMLFINVGYNSVNHSPGPQTLQMVNALWTADMLGAMAEAGTDVACYWAVHNFYPPRGGDYGYLSSEGSNTPRLSYYVFPMLTAHYLGNTVASQSDAAVVVAHAARDGKRLSVMLINRDPRHTHPVAVSFKSFAARSTASWQLLDDTRHAVRMADLSVKDGNVSVELPPYSLSVIDCIAADSVDAPANLARTAEATASSYSTIGPHFGPGSAIDGDVFTHWNSAAWTKSNGEETQWLQLRWDAPVEASVVRIQWGDSPAISYRLQSSLDGIDWTTLAVRDSSAGGTEEITFAPVVFKYLRMDGRKGSKGISAYSIRELGVFRARP